jgi:hypothetical protein
VGLLQESSSTHLYNYIHETILDKSFNLEGIDLSKQDVDLVFETNSHTPVALSAEVQLVSRKVDKVFER